MADPVLLAELLKNLVANALAYVGRGAIVTVRVVEEGKALVLEVEDNGPGLTSEQRAAALEAQRGAARPLPSLAKTEGSGMGLGLAITAEISALFGAGLELTTARGGRGLLARVSFAAPVA